MLKNLTHWVSGLEPELGEEPPIFASLKPLLEPCLGLLSGSDLLVTRLKSIRGNDVLQIDIEGISSGHDVVIVDELDEALNPGFLGLLFGGVFANDLLRVLGYAGDEAVAVWTVPCAVVEGTDDDAFATRITALKQDHCLPWLQELHHFSGVRSLCLSRRGEGGGFFFYRRARVRVLREYKGGCGMR